MVVYRNIEIVVSIKSRLRAFIIVLYFVFHAFDSLSQAVPRISYSSLAEKIYLQVDNTVYTTDQTMWFKAVVVNAANHTLTRLSGVLYVELIDPDENIVERKLIKLEQGIGNGFFQLSPNYPYGVYLLRAYTTWSQNFGQDFFFKEYIRIDGPESGIKDNLIKKVTIVEETGNNRRVKVQLDPLATDSIEAKGITFFVNTGTKKDTLVMKKSRDDQYLLAYRIPAKAEILTLQVQSGSQVNYSKTMVLDTNSLDVQFFPEGGELVQGLPALLGFKVLDYKGKGRATAGEIINSKGEVVASFKSNALGMGWVQWDKADSAAEYRARMSSPSGGWLPKQYALPAIAAKGNILSVRKNGDKILLKVLSNYLSDDSLVIRASCRGIVYFDFKGRLKEGSLEFSHPAQTLPEGIIDFTLLMQGRTPVAERLYFNEQSESRINLSIATDAQAYNQREKTALSITTKDNSGEPVAANVSVLVFNSTEQKNVQDFRETILSYFLLSSELRGEIENSGFYFREDTSRFNDVDALMLTQGWRKYNYQREPLVFKFEPESGLTVSGSVKGGLSIKKQCMVLS